MGYAANVASRLFDIGDIIGLYLRVEQKPTLLGFRVLGSEGPNNLYDFSLGAASALAAAGTGWSSVQDSASRYLIMPTTERVLYQIFYGVSPSHAWVYRAYPANQFRGGLVLPITIGGQYGYITGRESPRDAPQAVTETWTARDLTPAFIGYHPYGVPASLTVRMTFLIWRYDVEMIQMGPGALPKRKITVGGSPPVDATDWMLRRSGAVVPVGAPVPEPARGRL